MLRKVHWYLVTGVSEQPDYVILVFEDWTVDCLEMSVTTYQSTLRNIPEGRRSQNTNSIVPAKVQTVRKSCLYGRST